MSYQYESQAKRKCKNCTFSLLSRLKIKNGKEQNIKKGFRIEATIEPNKHDIRTSKELLEYTAGDIKNKGVNWMTDSEPNADAVTRKGDSFEIKFKNSAKNTLSLAIKETQMRVAPWRAKQYIETFSIRWIESGKTWDEYWRLLIFHRATVSRVDPINLPHGASYYNVIMKVESGVEYKKLDGNDA